MCKINLSEIIMLLQNSLQSLYDKDSYLIFNNNMYGFRHNSERSVTFRLGYYMQNIIVQCLKFNDYIVDIEYNRDLIDVKRNRVGEAIIPDLIIHKRGTNDSNLLILELKGWWTKNLGYELTNDQNKLRNIDGDLKYIYRISLLIGKTINECQIIFVLKNTESIPIHIFEDLSHDNVHKIESGWIQKHNPYKITHCKKLVQI